MNTVVLADDHEIVRKGVRSVLEADKKFTVLAEVADGLAAVAAVDQHKPDLVYTDGGVFGQIGRDLIAYYYNSNLSWHNGNQEGVYTLKFQRPGGKTGEYQEGAGTRDMERAVLSGISAEPFHTDMCLGQWQYFEGFEYKKSRDVIHTLIDVVRKHSVRIDVRESNQVHGLCDRNIILQGSTDFDDPFAGDAGERLCQREQTVGCRSLNR